ncbi:MAG: putative sulfate exporter family transporter [Planctomycetota bacterium]|nr:putative sulfate exporter family transporter [Planctomycetota bacterium]
MPEPPAIPGERPAPASTDRAGADVANAAPVRAGAPLGPQSSPAPSLATRIVFIATLIGVAGPWGRTDLALVAGIALALLGWTAFAREGKIVSKHLIQACVVLLGLRLDLGELARGAADGFALAVGTILGTLALGLALGRLLRSGTQVSVLVSSGTAICGGSAIAAVGSAIGASSSSMAVATGAVFILNAVGLWTLPPIGHALGLSEVQFGAWAGVALHDIASVGGAAKSYGPAALDTANIVKLTRVVWIFPIALVAGRLLRDGAPGNPKSPFPWFILLFVAASAVRTFVPALASIESEVKSVSGVGFQAALFLIGAGLSRAALRSVGWRAGAQAAVLWVIVAAASLGAVVWLSPDTDHTDEPGESAATTP